MIVPFHTRLTFDFCVLIHFRCFCLLRLSLGAPLNAVNPMYPLSSRTNVHIHAVVLPMLVEPSQTSIDLFAYNTGLLLR
jgi:hypothetical protein